MHPQHLLRFALTLLLGAVITSAFVVPDPFTGLGATPSIYERRANTRNIVQPPPTAPASTMYFPRQEPVRIEQDHNSDGQDKYTSTTDGHFEAGRSLQRGDVAGMPMAVFVALVTFGAVSFILFTYIMIMRFVCNGRTAAVRHYS
ncbi:hypothetical protein B0T20DRAFT_395160 [Sordaria brevicollis]|uniref:Uncharacterized protein n=1 Tax=Sordaria brevicollis TaxID=83679 RepID=A0AAE0PB13_SORBR|nr:hypothetical protein B0T20DRAFT_395160 [Sordaria brevicollis]